VLLYADGPVRTGAPTLSVSQQPRYCATGLNAVMRVAGLATGGAGGRGVPMGVKTVRLAETVTELMRDGSTVITDDSEMLSDKREPVGSTIVPDDSAPDEVRPDGSTLSEGRTLSDGGRLLESTLAPEGGRLPDGSTPEESKSEGSTLPDGSPLASVGRTVTPGGRLTPAG
jgi:hypothetical protein